MPKTKSAPVAKKRGPRRTVVAALKAAGATNHELEQVITKPDVAAAAVKCIRRAVRGDLQAVRRAVVEAARKLGIKKKDLIIVLTGK